MKVAFYTLGCKVNQYETQALEQLFSKQGFEIVAFSQPADVYVINTCTVTAVSDKKSRNAARRTKVLNPAGVLIVCGCYAQVEPQEVKELCGADIVVGSDKKGEIVALALDFLEGKAAIPTVASEKRPLFEHLPPGGLKDRTRALLKVQDGCQNFCTYCKIPYARGLSRSLPLEQAVSDVKHLAQSGYLEVVITGIEISSYGLDLCDKPSLAALITGVCNAAPTMRVRLGSLEPRTITEDFVGEISRLPNLCPHFHLSLQSGCDKTLKDMGRKYDTERYYESVCLLRSAFPSCAITTDVIVGFPCETSEDFSQTVAFVKKCAFASVHIFPFSRRKGTKAYDMPGQILKAVKETRASQLAVVVEALNGDYLQSKVGCILSVLFEQEEDGYFHGHSMEHCTVKAKGKNLHNKIMEVKITDISNGVLVGEIMP